MKKLIIILFVLFTLSSFAEGWMFIKYKATNLYAWIDSSDYSSSTMYDHNSVVYMAAYGRNGKDYAFVQKRIEDLVLVEPFFFQKEDAKDTICVYVAAEDDTIVAYYASQSMSLFEAADSLSKNTICNMKCIANALCVRLNSTDFQSKIALFLGNSQAMKLNDTLTSYRNQLCDIGLIGSEYNDENQIGIVDYLFSTTGTPYENAGLDYYTMSAITIAAYGSQALALAELRDYIDCILVEGD